MEQSIKRGGRPSAGKDKIIKRTLGATQSDWEWLELWRPNESVQESFRDLLERGRKMFPGGPHVFGHAINKPRRRSPRALYAWADAHGIPRDEAVMQAAESFLRIQQHEQK